MKYILYLIISFTFLSCKTKDLTNNKITLEENKVGLIESNAFSILNLEEIDKQDLLFNINELSIENNQLIAVVQYGGGCVKPHVFELVTDGLINEDANMNFYILHKTHDDKCKALIIEKLSFDLNNLYNLKSNLLKTITINAMKELPL